jgi:large subunit ribosomal protein L4
MPDAPYINKTGKLALDDEVFGAPFNESLVHEVVRAELNARRQGTASTKTRGKVRGGGAKPWRQKGTGRARAGSSRSPIWTGGGVTFGPSPRHYTFKVNRKARRAALRSALSLHAGRGSIGGLDAGAFEAPKTGAAAAALAKFNQASPTLVALAADEVAAAKSFRNIERVVVREADNVGIADLLAAATFVVSDAALAHLTARAKGEKADATETAEGVTA